MTLEPEQLAHCEPVGYFIQEELESRGWTAYNLACRMGGDVAVDILAVEMTIACSDDPDLLIDSDSDERMSRAFGVTPGMFVNLQNTYRRWKLAQEEGHGQD